MKYEAQPRASTEEQLLLSTLKKEIHGGKFEQPERLREDRSKIMEEQINTIAKIFNNMGRPWYLAGGMALELNFGSLTRDHQDIDVAIFHEDRERFFEYATSIGFTFFDIKGKAIESAEMFDKKKDNGFVSKVDDNIPGLTGFEILFLRKNNDGDVFFSHNNNLHFSPVIYENASCYTTPSGENIPLTPPDIQLLYKISEGRMIDLHDIKTYLAKLSNEEQKRLDEYIITLKMVFEIDERETSVPTELIRLAEENTPQFRKKLEVRGQALILETIGSTNKTLHKIYDIATRLPSPKNFLEKLEIEFGQKATTWSKQELDKAISLLFSEQRPSFSEFKDSFPIEEKVTQRLREEFRSMYRWHTKTK